MPTPARTTQAPPPAARSNRMALSAIKRGVVEIPKRTLLYGVEGVGKTSFAASAPNVIFIGAEEGFGRLDVNRFPQPQTFDDVLEAIHTLRVDTHGYNTLAIDTLDWLEPMIWRFICARDNKKDVEDYGYGKGYTAALDEWRVLLSQLETLRAAKHMEVVLLAHSWIKPFKNPEGDDFDRYEMKLNAKAAGLCKEWCDVVLFANHETFAHKDDKTKRIRGVSTGARVCYTTRTAAYDAKNRFDLPAQFPLSWEDYEAAMAAGAPADPLALAEEIKRKASEIGGDVEEKTTELLGKHLSNPGMLAKMNDRLNALLSEKQAAAEVA